VTITRENIPSPAFFSIYSNDIQVQTTPWDLRLTLGEIVAAPTPDKPVLTIKQLGELRISPQLAKRLAAIISGQIKAYEENFGQIPAPPEP
jgi:hypothetical protein